MPSIPAGYFEATMVLRPVLGSRDCTWSVGLDSADFATQSAGDVASLVYGALTGTGDLYIAASMSSDWTFRGVHVVKQMEEGPLSADAGAIITGTATAAQVPVNGTLLMSKITLLGGRRNRGRAYPPATMIGEGQIDSMGFIGSGQIAGVRAYFDSFYVQLVNAGLEPVLFHQTAPFTPTPIEEFYVEGQLATQRRRMRR